MTEPNGEHQRRKRGRWLVVAALVLGSYIAAIAVIGIADAEAALTRASLSPLLGTLGLQVVVVGMWAGVYRASVRALGGGLRPRQALAVSMPAFTLSHSVPRGSSSRSSQVISRTPP